MRKVSITIRTIIIFLIIVGIFGMSLNMIFGTDVITYLDKERIYDTGMWLYKFNFQQYFRSIESNIHNLSELELLVPTRTWISGGDLTNFVSVLSNNLLVILDYIILILNIIVYPLRVGAYIVQNLLAFMGVDIYANQEGIEWLTTLIRTLKGFQIPYL